MFNTQTKKEFVIKVGQNLIKDYGKLRFYKPEDVINAAQKVGYSNSDFKDWNNWALCIYSSHEDFDLYHLGSKENHDYVEMRKEMIGQMSNTDVSTLDWFAGLDFDMSWLDFGDVFDGLLEGIGEIFGGIFDGL